MTRHDTPGGLASAGAVQRRLDPAGEIERVRRACYDAGISCDAVMDLARLACSRSAAVESKPIAWRYKLKIGSDWKLVDSEEDCNQLPSYEREPLYAAPAIRSHAVASENEELRARLAGIIFSGELDNVTAGDLQRWRDEWKAKLNPSATPRIPRVSDTPMTDAKVAELQGKFSNVATDFLAMVAFAGQLERERDHCWGFRCRKCGAECNDPAELINTPPFTEDSIHAAWLIFEDCRERGQDAELSFRKAIRRLIPLGEEPK